LCYQQRFKAGSGFGSGGSSFVSLSWSQILTSLWSFSSFSKDGTLDRGLTGVPSRSTFAKQFWIGQDLMELAGDAGVLFCTTFC
jgi:hypothetical protein